MPTTSQPTLKDIARAAGVSMMTVSRVLRGAPKVAAEKREMVQQEAKRLNYQPDAHLVRTMQVVRGKKQRRVRPQRIQDFSMTNAGRESTPFDSAP